MIDAVLGIDVSKNTFDTNLGAGTKARSKSFANSPDGWHHLIAWLGEYKIGQVHACLEATGRHGLGIALALHEAGHVVSIVNPAQIRDFARTKLGRNKTDQVDAVHIREYAELFKPRPWTPPSPAMRRLCELQTIRAGTVAGLTEWKNRRGSGITDDLARSLAETTIQHFTGPDILGSSAAAAAYAGLNPQQHQSGISVNRPVRISKIGNAVLRTALYMPALSAMRYNPAVAALVDRLKAQGRLKGKQIVIAAMRKLLVLCFGVLKTGKKFDPAMAMGK
jgi:transposase